MPEFQEKQMRWHYYKNEGSDDKMFVSCQICDLHLCFTKEKLVLEASFVVFHHCYIAYEIPF